MTPIEAIDIYFKSANDVKVTRALIKREEWEAVKESLSALESENKELIRQRNVLQDNGVIKNDKINNLESQLSAQSEKKDV